MLIWVIHFHLAAFLGCYSTPFDWKSNFLNASESQLFCTIKSFLTNISSQSGQRQYCLHLEPLYHHHCSRWAAPWGVNPQQHEAVGRRLESHTQLTSCYAWSPQHGYELELKSAHWTDCHEIICTSKSILLLSNRGALNVDPFWGWVSLTARSQRHRNTHGS